MTTDIVRLGEAARALAAIDTPEEALKLMKVAEAARVYAKQMKLGTEAENLATAIRMKAEVRLAETVTAAQERGELATQADTHRVGPHHSALDLDASGDHKAPVSSLGIPRWRIDEARLIAKHVGADGVDELIAEADAKDKSISRADIVGVARSRQRAANGRPDPVPATGDAVAREVINGLWRILQNKVEVRDQQLRDRLGSTLEYGAREWADRQATTADLFADIDSFLGSAK